MFKFICWNVSGKFRKNRKKRKVRNVHADVWATHIHTVRDFSLQDTYAPRKNKQKKQAARMRVSYSRGRAHAHI